MTARVTVVYDGGLDPELDWTIRRVAVFHGGRECGSGQMIVSPFRRDIEFEFDSTHDKVCFIRYLLPETRHFNSALDKVRVL